MNNIPKAMKAIIVSMVLLAAISLSVNAQKLNSVQEGGMRAPAKVKVDAQLTEWGNTFKAFNKNADIYYTMANDDADLYIVIKADNQVISNKIIGGGINFTINPAGKKNDKDAFIIVFPVVDVAALRTQMMSMRRPGPPGGGGFGGPPGGAPGGGGPDSATIATMRKKAIAAAKEIKLIGFKDIPDSVLSIYNEYGIKAFIDFDNQGSLVMEMALPLKYVNLSVNDKKEFAYNIKLNGINIGAMMGGGPSPAMAVRMGGGGFGGGGGGFGGGGGGFGGGGGGGMGGPPGGGGIAGGDIPKGMADMVNMISPTDFWGKYQLIKK